MARGALSGRADLRAAAESAGMRDRDAGESPGPPLPGNELSPGERVFSPYAEGARARGTLLPGMSFRATALLYLCRCANEAGMIARIQRAHGRGAIWLRRGVRLRGSFRGSGALELFNLLACARVVLWQCAQRLFVIWDEDCNKTLQSDLSGSVVDALPGTASCDKEVIRMLNGI